MNKRVVMFSAFIGMTIGGLIPVLFGWDLTGLGGPSLLGGFIGGIAAIVVVVKFAKRYGL